MSKKDSPFQYGALPFRMAKGVLQVGLITSRETKRWIIPKGWPEKYLLAYQVAEREAYEEAGFEGSVRETPLAAFDYMKRFAPDVCRLCKIVVFPLEVRCELEDWPEKGQRQRRWATTAEAAELVSEGGLSEIFKRAGREPSWLLEGGMIYPFEGGEFF